MLACAGRFPAAKERASEGRFLGSHEGGICSTKGAGCNGAARPLEDLCVVAPGSVCHVNPVMIVMAYAKINLGGFTMKKAVQKPPVRRGLSREEFEDQRIDIDVSLIPKHVADALAEATLKATVEYFQKPMAG